MLVIDRKLNLVVPIDRANGEKIYVHAMPIGTETFEKNYLVLAKVFSAFVDNGIVVTSAPSVARLILKQVAQNTPRNGDGNWWDGDDGVGGKSGLLAEIVRLCNVIDVDRVRPLNDVLAEGMFSEDEKNDLLSILVFFTVASRIPPRMDRERLIRGLASIYQLQTTSLTTTEYQNSLKTSTSVDNTGGKVPE